MSQKSKKKAFKKTVSTASNATEGSKKIRAEKPSVYLASMRPKVMLRNAVQVERWGQERYNRELSCE